VPLWPAAADTSNGSPGSRRSRPPGSVNVFTSTYLVVFSLNGIFFDGGRESAILSRFLQGATMPNRLPLRPVSASEKAQIRRLAASRSKPARSQVRALPTFLTPSCRIRPRPVSRPQACLPPALRRRPLGRASRRHRQRALFGYFVHWPRNSVLRFTTVFNFSGSSLPT